MVDLKKSDFGINIIQAYQIISPSAFSILNVYVVCGGWELLTHICYWSRL